MRIRINKTKFRLYLGALLFFLSGHLYLIVDQTTERLFLFASIPFFYKEYGTIFSVKKGAWFDRVHFLFLLCFLIDIVLYLTLTPVLYAMGMFYIWVIAFKVFPYIGKRYGVDFYQWAFKLNLYISLLVICLCYILKPIQLVNYRGFFANPNTFGNYAAFTIAFLLPLFLERFKKRNMERIGLSILFFVVLCFSTIISSSRTAFLTLILELILYVFQVFKISFDYKYKALFKKMFYGLLTIVCLLICLVVFTDIMQILQDAVFDKFEHLEGNQLNGRDEFWHFIWMDSDVFENGFKDIGAPHNVYFGLVDQFGKLAGVLYLLFVFLNFVKLLGISVKKDSNFWNYCAAFSALVFMSVSMTESYLLTNSMLWFYIMIPIQECIESKEVNLNVRL